MDNLADRSYSKEQPQPRIGWKLGKEPGVDLADWHVHGGIPWLMALVSLST
jgi:hypothetical protein